MIAIIYLITTIIFTEVIDRIEKRVRIPGIGYDKSIGSRAGF